MKISNSKKQLAKIIHENGGWRDGYGFSAQDGDDCAVWFYDGRPVPGSGRRWKACGRAHRGIEGVDKLPNWHQTILSRDEYFHLYPAPVKIVVENKTTCNLTVSGEPTIEQLASDYSNRKDYADRKQQEADAAKADAETKLAELVAVCKAIGLVLSVTEPEKPAKPYTGRFYTDCTDERNYQTLCDGCGKRYGLHYGDRCEPGSEG